MGTMRATFTGKTKAEVLEQYRKMKRKHGATFLMHMPSGEKEALKEMKQDTNSGEWVLKVVFTM